MDNEDFTELTPDEITARLKQEDVWRLKDIILLVHGYEYKDVLWDFHLEGTHTNSFPARQYATAIEATNSLKPQKRLDHVCKIPDNSPFVEILVKKSTFFKWAEKTWYNVPRVKKVVAIWRKYKGVNKGTSPALETNKAKVKNYGDKLQIEEFLEHCKTKNPKIFKADMVAIAKRVQKELKGVNLTQLNSYRTYVKRMPIEDLMKHLPADAEQF